MRNWTIPSTSIPSTLGYRSRPFRPAVITGIFIIVLSAGFSLQAQDRTALEKKREQLLEEIRFTERLLSKTRKDASTATADISALNRKIQLREDLIEGLEQEVRVLQREVRLNEGKIEDLNEQMEKLKANYAGSVYNSYKYQKVNQQLLFVLGAESINQAVRRLNYLRKLNHQRKEQAGEIEATADEIRKNLAALEVMRQDKSNLLAENRVQMKQLESEKVEKNSFVSRLKRNEQKYRDDIRKKDDEAKKLDKEIRLIIERELAARESNSSGLSRTPEALARLSQDFVSNKGKLPWPVEEGYVSRRFGKQSHPDINNLQVNNNGIDIRTAKDGPVRAVFNGEVVSVFTNPMFKHAVIVKHGEYFTVYTKLGSVNVKKGDAVSTKQVIGYAHTENGVSEVHLEVWKGKTNLDPYTWIASK